MVLHYTMQVRFLWLIGQAVKTSPSHGENRGSIPLSAALLKIVEIFQKILAIFKRIYYTEQGS